MCFESTRCIGSPRHGSLSGIMVCSRVSRLISLTFLAHPALGLCTHISFMLLIGADFEMQMVVCKESGFNVHSGPPAASPHASWGETG